MKGKIIIETISIAFIFLFTYAAVSKLMDVQEFKSQIGQSPMLADIASFAAWAIPLVELIISLLLVCRRTRILGLFGSFSLMVMFTTYIILVLHFSDHIPCACGGVLSYLGWKEHLVFNVAFVLLAALGILLVTRTKPGKLMHT